MTDDSAKESCRTGKQQSMPSKRSWIALLFAGLGVAVAVHRGSTLLQTWQWEELGNVQPLLWLPISFRQPQNENATAYLVQVGYVSEKSLVQQLLSPVPKKDTDVSRPVQHKCVSINSLRCQAVTAGRGSA